MIGGVLVFSGRMKMAQIQLKVVKTDGSVEGYLYTKIIGTIANALATVYKDDIMVSEQLAEAVTYFLYNKRDGQDVRSDEIYSIIEAVLTGTGYGLAAEVLSEHRLRRRLKRQRLEVISVDVCRLGDVELLFEAEKSCCRSCWDKSRIVNDLITKHDIDRQSARMIAGMVEQKIFCMSVRRVTAGLIRELVCSEATGVLRARRQLQLA